MMTRIYHDVMLSILTVSLFVYAGCSREGLSGYYSLGSPEHHFATGMKLMERYNLDNVEREFVRALRLNADFAPAYVGLALVSSARRDFDRAHELLEKAREKSKTDEDMATVAMGSIKIYTDLYKVDKESGKASAWLEVAEETYRKGLRYNSNDPALHFFMGRAYVVGGKYDKAEDSFRQVVELNSGYTAQALEELDSLSRINAKKIE